MTKIPAAMIAKVCNVIMGDNSENACLDVLVEKALEDAGVGELISVLQFIRPALPVIQCMTGRIGLDLGEAKSVEMMNAIDEVLTKIGAAP